MPRGCVQGTCYCCSVTVGWSWLSLPVYSWLPCVWKSMDSVLSEQLLHECELDNVVDPDIYKPQVSGAYKSIVDQYTIA